MLASRIHGVGLCANEAVSSSPPRTSPYDFASHSACGKTTIASSSRATGLDQIPEPLFPLLACRSALQLTAIDIVVGCAIFFVGEVLLSKLFFWLRLRDHPY